MPDDDPMMGQVLANRYTLSGVVGRGGMASVYQAWDARLDRFVAVKIFSVGEASDDARRQSEVKLLARLNNPNLVTLHDAHFASESSPEPSYLVMELVQGPDLGRRLSQGALGGDEVAGFAVELAEALTTIHDAGIVHRDLKPGNILLAPTGLKSPAWHAKIGDFGIAHLIGAESLTTVGTVIGTAAYLSPEQATGSDAGPASDVYALGLLILECLTGQREFSGTVIEAVSSKLARDPQIPADIPPEWAALLAKMTARNPALRPTAGELAEEFRVVAPALAEWNRAPNRGTGELESTAPMLAPTKRMPAVTNSSSAEPTARTIVDPLRPNPNVKPTVARRKRGGLIALTGLVVAALIAIGVVAGALSHPEVQPPLPTSTTTIHPLETTPTSVPTVAPVKPVKPGKGNGHGKGNG